MLSQDEVDFPHRTDDRTGGLATAPNSPTRLVLSLGSSLFAGTRHSWRIETDSWRLEVLGSIAVIGWTPTRLAATRIFLRL